MSVITLGAFYLVFLQSAVGVEQVQPDTDRFDIELFENKPQAQAEDKTSSANAELSTDLPQLSERERQKQIQQLAKRDLNTQAAPSLSKPETTLDDVDVKIAGADQCDPERQTEGNREFCETIAENRSAEYTIPDRNRLTPEQRLLGERRFETDTSGPDAAVRRLASGDNSADDQGNQMIAAIVLNSSVPAGSGSEAQNEPADVGAEAQALIEAIVNNLTVPPGP